MKDSGATPSESAVRKSRRYITLHDRTWKGKEWWSSGFRGYQYVRSLTDEEAKTLDDIELAHEIIKPKPFEKIIDEKEARAGRLSCIRCGSKKGFFVYKMHRGKQSGWYEILRCPDCGAREKRMR